MSTLVAQTISNGTISTSSANVISGSAKAWVNFNGTGTVAIRSSYNVSSITDNGTGLYTVNFTNAMPNANYADAQSGSNRAIGMTSTYSASSVQVSNEDKTLSFGASRTDTSTVCVSIFSL